LVATPPTSAELGEIRVGWAQGNANAGLFANPVRGSILQNHIDATQRLLSSKPLAADVLVWPENAVDTNPLGASKAGQRISRLVDQQLKVPLIFGTITERGEQVFNSSILWKPEVGPVDWYDKKRPVPFAEYVPNRDFWYSLAPDLVGLISRGYSFGDRDGIFSIPKADLGVLICFEIAIDSVARELVTDGANIILSQTNNADFGYSDETYQQFAFARLRAIETGRAIANVSTVGVSASILPDGSVIDEVPAFEPAAKISTLPLRESLTPAYYSAIPVKFAIAAAALAGLLIAWRSRGLKGKPDA
jgi:apolipoprotein N-acyltransferase